MEGLGFAVGGIGAMIFAIWLMMVVAGPITMVAYALAAVGFAVTLGAAYELEKAGGPPAAR